MPNYPCPLNDQDCAELTAIAQSCHGTEEMCRDMKELGLPVDDQMAANAQQKAFAEAAKRKYFPYNP